MGSRLGRSYDFSRGSWSPGVERGEGVEASPEESPGQSWGSGEEPALLSFWRRSPFNRSVERAECDLRLKGVSASST